jgi:hypothetical protein
MEKITVTWFDDSHTTILCTYNQEGWTWEDFFKALNQQKTLIESTPTPKVSVVVDVRKSSWMPRGGSLLSGMRKFSNEKHPRQGQTIVVGARGMVASIASTVVKLLRSSKPEMVFAPTMEEAQRLLQSGQREEVKKAG